jgi:hypothetical protein
MRPISKSVAEIERCDSKRSYHVNFSSPFLVPHHRPLCDPPFGERRKSKSRGKLFFRLLQQSAGTSPKTYDTLIGRSKPAKRTAQQVGVG